MRVPEHIPEGYKEIKTISESEKNRVLLVQGEDGASYVCKILSGKHEAYNTLIGITHPFLPEIKYADVSEDKTVIVEEYIDGTGLNGNDLTEPQMVSIFKELCDVLAFLHSENIIHRDIKPSNILIAPDKHIRLIDFDAARIVKDDADSDTRNLGTKGYAPPEQYGFGQTDARADIYALGVTMKILLGDNSKEPPYSGIIKKCTDFNPDKRYRSALMVKNALNRYVYRKYFFTAAALILIVAVILLTSSNPDQKNDNALKKNSSSNTINATASQEALQAVDREHSTGEAIKSSASKDGTEETQNNSAEGDIPEKTNSDTLFHAEKYDYINMDGNTAKLWDQEKTMSADVNGDGLNEVFTIANDPNEGLLLEGMQGKIQDGVNPAMNFWTWNVSALLPDDLKEGNCIAGHCFVQISCCDIDEDGIKEVLVSVGDKQNKNITAIYEYSDGSETPFTYCGSINCDTIIRYRGSNIIWAYRGNLSDNQYDSYIYDDSGVRKLTGTIYDELDMAKEKDMSLREIHEMINGHEEQ